MIQAEPDFVDAINNLGIVYLTCGKFEEASVRFRQLIAIDAQNPIAHFNLGMAFKSLGQLTEAKAELETAISNSDENCERSRRARSMIVEMT